MLEKQHKTALRYRPEYAEALVRFFDVDPFRITEVMKKDGSVSVVETAAELPTFAGFAKQIGTTTGQLKQWETLHPAFALSAQKARDLQGNILVQNSLRGNYSSSFAVFTAKNLLGWRESKEDPVTGPLIVRWEGEDETRSNG